MVSFGFHMFLMSAQAPENARMDLYRLSCWLQACVFTLITVAFTCVQAFVSPTLPVSLDLAPF